MDLQATSSERPGVDDDHRVWFGVAEACIWIATVPGQALTGGGGVPARIMQRLLRGGAAGGEDGQRAGLQVFEAIARQRNVAVLPGVAADLRRAGIHLNTPGDDRVATDGLSRGLGRVLATLMQDGWWGSEAVKIANWVFYAQPAAMACILDAAVRQAGASAAALGCILCAGGWEEAFTGQRLSPKAVAWLTGGLRLAMDSSARDTIESAYPLGNGVARDNLIGALVASVGGFSAEEARRYRLAQPSVAGAVRDYNASAARLAAIAGTGPGRLAVGGLGVADMQTSARACNMALEAERAIDSAFDMNQTARRLGDGAVVRKPRRLA